MTRIIGGQLRGRKLQVPAGHKVRPSSDRIKEALFNILDHRINWPGFTVLDLYAGSGALGIEALSRGAGRAYFVDCSYWHLKTLQQNLDACGLEASLATAIVDNAELWIRKFHDPGQPCLVFIDPPFQDSHYEPILSALASLPSIKPHSLIVIEAPKKLEFQFPRSLSLLIRKVYGNVALHLLEKDSEKPARV